MIKPRKVQTAADVADHYDELDAVYRETWGEHVHHGYWRTGRETAAEAAEAMTELVAQHLATRPGQKFCDIGCGYGASADFLASRFGVEVTGLSLSGAQVAAAQNRRPTAGAIHIVQRDWLANGLPSLFFDGAYAIESSEHMVDKLRFFEEAARVLKPGAPLVVCSWLASRAPSKFAVKHLLEPICREGRLPSMGSREEYDALAAAAGFHLIGYRDISRKVSRTWTICARRLCWMFATNRELRRMALDPAISNRFFLFSIPRLMAALRSGAMRYGIFSWRKGSLPEVRR